MDDDEMKNEIKITELRTIDLKLKENELGLEILVRNIYGEWSTGFWLEISEDGEMMERIFEHVMGMQCAARAYSEYKGYALGIGGSAEDEIIDREETVAKASIFFNKFISAKEKYKNKELGKEELKLLETEEIDFEDENLGALSMSREERLVYFILRAGYVKKEMPYAALDDLERAFKLDVEIGLEEKYRGRLGELRDRDIGKGLLSRIEALIVDIRNDLQQAGYELEMKTKYEMSEEEAETEIELASMEELLLPDFTSAPPLRIRDGEEEEYMDLLFAIESVIADYYRKNPTIKDIMVINALKKLKKDLMGRHRDGGLEDVIQLRIRAALSSKRRTKQEVLLCLSHVLKSVKLHRQIDGSRGYLNFIVGYA